MTQESLIRTQIAHHAEEISRLSQAVNQVNINMAILTEKQTTLIERLDSILDHGLSGFDSRLKQLESMLLANEGRMQLLRSLSKAWPILIVLVFVGFLVGIIKADDVNQLRSTLQTLSMK